jgi:hypothetical protein
VATRRTAAEGVLSKAEQLLHLPQMVWSGASIAKIPFFSGIWMDFGGKNRQTIFEILGFAQKIGEFITKHVDFTSKHWMSPTKH